MGYSVRADNRGLLDDGPCSFLVLPQFVAPGIFDVLGVGMSLGGSILGSSGHHSPVITVKVPQRSRVPRVFLIKE